MQANRHILLSLGLLFALSGCMGMMKVMAPSVEAEKNISAAFPFESKYVDVAGSRMHYVEVGSGVPVVFVHGNPTSSYLWRNVLPIVGKNHRAIAVDLVGMGNSDKPAIEYHLEEHIRYFDGFMQALGIKEYYLVLHDWGGPIGLDFALRHPAEVKGIVVMETLLRPMQWAKMDFGTRMMFRKFRDPVDGEQLNVRENFFVEEMIPIASGRKLSAEEMSHYKQPYLRESDRKPVAQWPREIPIDGEPKGNYERISSNFESLKKSTVPLLLLQGSPGMISTAEAVDELKVEPPRMQVVSIGPGMHYIQESQPTRVGSEITKWLGLESR